MGSKGTGKIRRNLPAVTVLQWPSPLPGDGNTTSLLPSQCHCHRSNVPTTAPSSEAPRPLCILLPNEAPAALRGPKCGDGHRHVWASVTWRHIHLVLDSQITRVLTVSGRVLHIWLIVREALTKTSSSGAAATAVCWGGGAQLPPPSPPWQQTVLPAVTGWRRLERPHPGPHPGSSGKPSPSHPRHYPSAVKLMSGVLRSTESHNRTHLHGMFPQYHKVLQYFKVEATEAEARTPEDS